MREIERTRFLTLRSVGDNSYTSDVSLSDTVIGYLSVGETSFRSVGDNTYLSLGESFSYLTVGETSLRSVGDTR